MNDCILFIYPGHRAEIVQALREEFGKPVVLVMLWQYLERAMNLSPAQKDAIGAVASLPEFYFRHIGRVRAMDWAELDALQLSLEARLGVDGNTMLVSYDRNFLCVSDYRTSRELQVIQLLFVEELFQAHSPSLVISGRECYVRHLISDTALRLGIPAASFGPARHVGHRIGVFDAQGQQLGMRQSFEALRRGDETGIDKEDLARADALYEAFISRPAMPNYMATYIAPSVRHNIATVLSGGYRSVLNGARLHAENEYDRLTGQIPSPTAVVGRWPLKAYRMTVLERCGYLNKKPDLSRKYIYVPLHQYPEETDMYYGREYCHHEAYILNLARRIPSDYRLYVKDHSCMFGTRPLSFFQRLREQYNVEMVHHNFNTFELIMNARATLTVTGTAGWEAYLLNRPAVVLGEVYYNFLPGLLRISLGDRDFQARLENYIDTFTPDEPQRRAALRACCLSSEFIGAHAGPEDMFSDVAHAGAMARSIRSLAERWGSTITRHARERGMGPCRLGPAPDAPGERP